MHQLTGVGWLTTGPKSFSLEELARAALSAGTLSGLREERDRAANVWMDDAAVLVAAKAHHAEYERLAPVYRYETRKQTRVPWDELPHSMRLLMIDSERQALRAALAPREDERA
jgi:hypothetical protein